ncbi:GntR family transcriptional regulator [Moorella naiadis]|uniref:GntR family transcriptional regulator n=1 Tax=Moorella naiadis (nom. illeg.) TaxID=3093670 RepID=UPI003D9CACA7
MALNLKLERNTLRGQATDLLLAMIKEKHFPDNKLPGEEELARLMGVSRATVREALSSLARLGYITKKHGKGNYGHPTIANLPARLDMTTDFLDLLKSQGRSPRVVHGDLRRTRNFSPEAGAALGLMAGDEVIKLDRIYYLDDRPAILAEIEIPRKRLRQLPDGEANNLTFKDFYETYCAGELVKMVMNIKSRIYPQAAELFKVDVSTPLLWWEEKWLTLEDEPACYAGIYFNPGATSITMVVNLV